MYKKKPIPTTTELPTVLFGGAVMEHRGAVLEVFGTNVETTTWRSSTKAMTPTAAKRSGVRRSWGSRPLRWLLQLLKATDPFCVKLRL